MNFGVTFNLKACDFGTAHEVMQCFNAKMHDFIGDITFAFLKRFFPHSFQKGNLDIILVDQKTLH